MNLNHTNKHMWAEKAAVRPGHGVLLFGRLLLGGGGGKKSFFGGSKKPPLNELGA